MTPDFYLSGWFGFRGSGHDRQASHTANQQTMSVQDRQLLDDRWDQIVTEGRSHLRHSLAVSVVLRVRSCSNIGYPEQCVVANESGPAATLLVGCLYRTSPFQSVMLQEPCQILF